MVVSSSENNAQQVGESSSFDQHNPSEPKRSIMNELLRRMNPNVCFGACGGNVGWSLSSTVNSSSVIGSNLRTVVPDLMKHIDFDEKDLDDWSSSTTQHHKNKKRSVALKNLYELSSHKVNRVPLVCTQKYCVIPILAKCLTWNFKSTNTNNFCNDEIRRVACLTLNQLSLPFQNKKVMVFGMNETESNHLIQNLNNIIRQRLPETYLCCICLMNLTFLENAIEPIIQFSPQNYDLSRNPSLCKSISNRQCHNSNPKNWKPLKGNISNCTVPCLDDPNSLLRSIECLMHEHRPFLMSKILSMEGEAIRWSVGLLRNLTKKERHCSIIAKTDIPSLVLSFVQHSPHQIIRWSKDSLEEMSLTVLGNLSDCEESRNILRLCNAVDVLRSLDEERERLGLNLITARILDSLEG